MSRLILAFLAFAFVSTAWAQQSNYIPGQIVGGMAGNPSTLNSSATITTSGTFQTLLASTQISNTTRRQALTIENNNAAGPNCWIYLGPTASATIANSILLPVGGSYTRYWPYVPSDNIAGTCGANATTIYLDVQ